MIRQVSDVHALCFMSLFQEMRGDKYWDELIQWVGSGKAVPMLNLAVIDNGIVGLFPCELKQDMILIHACFLKDYRGRFARDAAQDAFKWIFNNTNYSKIHAYIEPEHVKKYAVECGMAEIDGLYEVSR